MPATRRYAPGTAVGAAHLKKPFQTHLGESGCDVVLEIRHAGKLTFETGQHAVHVVPERPPGHVDVIVTAMQKIHGHIEYVVDPLLVTEIVVEHQAGTPLRAASVSVQAWARVESHPDGRPSLNGELANSAVATG